MKKIITFIVLLILALPSFADQLMSTRGIRKSLRITEGTVKVIGTWKQMEEMVYISCFKLSETGGFCEVVDIGHSGLIIENDYEVTGWTSRGLHARNITPISIENLDIDFETREVSITRIIKGQRDFVESLQ